MESNCRRGFAFSLAGAVSVCAAALGRLDRDIRRWSVSDPTELLLGGGSEQPENDRTDL